MEDKTIKLIDELLEHFSYIHNEWEIENLKEIKRDYISMKIKLDWHEEHFNG
ncbi:hypothetical protein [Pectobacterium phage PcaP2EGY]